MAISKSKREAVYQKYNGHCAYCGCEIPEKGFNVDPEDITVEEARNDILKALKEMNSPLLKGGSGK